MGDRSRIEWTDATWNPVRGCQMVSEGCRNCYAMRQANRHRDGAYKGLTEIRGGRPVWTGNVWEVPERLHDPLKWTRPRRIFVASMSDPFHHLVRDAFLEALFNVMADAYWHRFQLLTKRADRLQQFMSARYGRWQDPPPNVWVGVSVENQEAADERIPLLQDTPAAVRWISAEPLLGPLELRDYLVGPAWRCPACQKTTDEPAMVGIGNPDSRPWCPSCSEPRELEAAVSDHLHWVVAGGESGPGARPAHPDWFRSLRDQCDAAAVPFFFKQWGDWGPPGLPTTGEPSRYAIVGQNGAPSYASWFPRFPSFDRNGRAVLERRGKKANGRELDGRTHEGYPEVSR